MPAPPRTDVAAQRGGWSQVGEVVKVVQATIPNQKGVPVVREWMAARFAGSELRVAGVNPFEVAVERLQLNRLAYTNSSAPFPEHLRKQ